MMNASGKVRHVVAWLPVVRWGICLLLWAAVTVVWLLPHLELSLRAIAPLGLTAAICRTLVVLVSRRGEPVPAFWLGLALCADAALLTGLLDITGGLFNPFIVMYVTYVWLAAVTVSPAWGVVVSATCAVGFGWLVVDHLAAEMATHHRLNDFPAHLFTMALAGAAIAELVAHYVGRARAELAQRQRELDEARDRALRSEHLAALTTLAAGAAHELSTPLATIAVAARELERNANRLSAQFPPVAPLNEDARLIRTEVDRCRVILDGMSGRAQGGSPLAAEPMAPSVLAQLVRGRLSEERQDRFCVEIEPAAAAPAVAGAAMVQALSTLLANAFEASGPASTVSLRFLQRGAMVRVEVHDRGSGMSPEVRRRAGEPFFTTKETGYGLGLGLFLTRTFAERSGGTLHFETNDGTTAILEIPAASAAGVAP
ncbi:MAG: ATP-binding protein [Vicinamibacterales bacterium]